MGLIGMDKISRVQVAVNFLEEEKSDSKITIKASGLFVEIPSDISAITLQTIIEALRC